MAESDAAAVLKQESEDGSHLPPGKIRIFFTTIHSLLF